MRNNNENGNVLFIILIAVALFGALSYTVAGMLRGGGEASISEEKANIYASEILDYGRSIRQAVQGLRIANNCSDTQISFQYDEDNDGDYNDNDENYYNPNAPTDHSCHVFHSGGAGLNWYSPNLEFYETAAADSSPSYGKVFFVAFFEVLNIGSDCNADSCVELTFVMPDLKPAICNAVNEKLGIGSISQDGITNFSPRGFMPAEFIGEFNFVNSGSILGETSSANAGKPNGCFIRVGDQLMSFYQVLIAR